MLLYVYDFVVYDLCLDLMRAIVVCCECVDDVSLLICGVDVFGMRCAVLCGVCADGCVACCVLAVAACSLVLFRFDCLHACTCFEIVAVADWVCDVDDSRCCVIVLCCYACELCEG